MARPAKEKCVCKLPACTRFKSTNKSAKEIIILSVEEYEVIRLLDCVGLSQDKAAEAMNASRTTITRLYESARKKTAQYLVNGYELIVEGGSYHLCAEQDCNNCPKRKKLLELDDSNN